MNYSSEQANEFASIVKHEEARALAHLRALFPNHPSVFIKTLESLLSSTIALNQRFAEIVEQCRVKGVETVLQFGSSVYGQNYSVNRHTDLDIEIVVDEGFDIGALKNTVLAEYH